MPLKVSEIMNIFADKNAGVGTNHHDLMPDKYTILSPQWLIDGKYFPPTNYSFNDPRDEFDMWWAYNHYEPPTYGGYGVWSWPPDAGTHVAGYKLNNAVWDEIEPKFRDGLKRLTNVALDRGTWSDSYEKGTLTQIAAEVNSLEVDLRDFVSGPDGKGGLVKQFERLNLSEDGGFKGTAAGAFGNRLYELATRLEDMYEKLNKIDAPLSEIPDKLAKDLSNLEEKVNLWYGDQSTKAYNILYDWYYGTSAGSETWNEERGQFQALITDSGVTGIISDQDEQEDSKGSGPTTMAIKEELNRRWEEKFKDVDDYANALLSSMQDVYDTAYGKIRIFTPPVGDQLDPYKSAGQGGGGSEGGGTDIPPDLFDGIFDDVFDDGMFDNMFDDGMFDDMFPENMFDDMFPENMFDDMFPENMFDDMFPEDMFDDMFPEDMFPEGPAGGGLEGPPNSEEYYNPESSPPPGPAGGGLDGPGSADDNLGNYSPPPNFSSGPAGGGMNDGPGNNVPTPPPNFSSGPAGGGLNGDPGSNTPGNNTPGNYIPTPPPGFSSGPAGGGMNGPGPGRNRQVLETDPKTGLPINPETGEPFPVNPDSGLPYDPETGLPVLTDPETGEVRPINPLTGDPFAPDMQPPTLETDPETGLPINPETGEPFPVNPDSGLPYDPETGLPVLTDPETGEVRPIDPLTGQPEGYSPDADGDMPAFDGPQSPELDQPEIPEPPAAPDYSDFGGGSNLDPPPTSSQPDFPDYSNGGQGPQSSDRSTLFSGPTPDSAAGPGGPDSTWASGPAGGGMRNGPEVPSSSGGGGGGSGLGNGTGTGGGPGTGNGSGMGSGMGRGMMPMMPPGGMGGGGGGQNNRERERTTWLSEDERVWGTAEGRNSTVLGRPSPGADKRSALRNELLEPGGERTRTGSSGEDAPRSGGRKRKPGGGNRGGRGKEQTGRGDGEREG